MAANAKREGDVVCGGMGHSASVLNVEQLALIPEEGVYLSVRCTDATGILQWQQ